jgi:hypothetical protein
VCNGAAAQSGGWERRAAAAPVAAAAAEQASKGLGQSGSQWRFRTTVHCKAHYELTARSWGGSCGAVAAGAAADSRADGQMKSRGA